MSVLTAGTRAAKRLAIHANSFRKFNRRIRRVGRTVVCLEFMRTTERNREEERKKKGSGTVETKKGDRIGEFTWIETNGRYEEETTVR